MSAHEPAAVPPGGPRAFVPTSGPGDGGQLPSPTDPVFVFEGQRLLIAERGARASIPRWQDIARSLPALPRALMLGHLNGETVWVAEGSFPDAADQLPAGLSLRGLRGLFSRLSDAEFWAAARAVQIAAWDRDHQFCGRCGGITMRAAFEYRRSCSACALDCFPRLAPAVIVLIHRGDEILLARHRKLPDGMFSTLAGFVEPGESLEETIEREIAEEVGLKVTEPQYFGSQPWPFPHSLMVGFFVRYSGGEIVLGRDAGGEIELEEADWFEIGDLPKIPPRISIARALIDAYAASRQ